MLAQMCSNRAVVDSFECCLDDLVECFEDFFRKSLIVILVGIGIIVGLLCYLLKMVSERPVLNIPRNVPVNTTHPQNEVKEVNEEICCATVEQTVPEINKLKENEDMNIDNIDDKKVISNTDIKNKKLNTETSQTIKTLNLPTSASFDESVLREVGCSECSKHPCVCSSNTHVYSASRVPVPSLSTSSSRYKLTPCLRKRPLNKSNVPSLQIGPNMKQGSCCSMCRLDEPKGGFV